MTRLVIAILILSALTGCASLSGPAIQTVNVQTVQDHKEVEDAGCILANGNGRWFITTPGKISINKNVDDLTVECSKEGVGTGSETITSKANAGLWGNLVVGGPVGYLVDRKSGAGYDYPQTIVVVLKSAAEENNTAAMTPPEVENNAAAVSQPEAENQQMAPDDGWNPPQDGATEPPAAAAAAAKIILTPAPPATMHEAPAIAPAPAAAPQENVPPDGVNAWQNAPASTAPKTHYYQSY